MTGVREIGALFGEIRDHVEGGCIEWGSALLQDGAEIVVHFGEEFAWIVGFGS
jgi:hypothetical protein